MAIQRLWRGRPRGLRELPAAVREAEKYEDGKWFLDVALLSVNGRHLKLTFDNGRTDYWRFVTQMTVGIGEGSTRHGTWVLDLDGPTREQLLEPAEQPKSTPADSWATPPIVYEDLTQQNEPIQPEDEIGGEG